MPDSLPDPSRRSPSFLVAAAVFFALLFFYVWRIINPGLIYHGYWLTMTFPVFQVSLAFLKEFITHPGGPVEYISAFLWQLYYYPWLGALIITGVAALLSLTTWFFLGRLTGTAPALLHFVPVVVLALGYNRYRDLLAPALAILVAMAGVCLHVHGARLRAVWRGGLFLVLSGAVYYLAGGAYLVCAALCGLFTLVAERRWWLGTACVLWGAAVPYVVGKAALGLRIGDAYLRLCPFHQDSDSRAFGFLLGLYLCVLVVPMWAALWAAARSWLLPGEGGVPSSQTERFLVQVLAGRRSLAFEVGAPVILGAVVLCFSFDRHLRTLFEVEYHALHREWPQLLRAARRLPLRRYSFFVNLDVNRALYHTGRLPYEMFSHLQSVLGLVPSATLLPAQKVPHPLWMKLSDVLLELGRVNEAEHMAYEALEMLGDHPRIIQRLALIAAAKGETRTARILLGMLSRYLLYGRWAKGYLARLEADPTASWDEEVRRLRSLRVDADVAGWAEPAHMLEQSLQKNKQNKMAFEYLMAEHLLNRDLAGVVGNIGRLGDYGYLSIPTHYEEALAIYLALSGQGHYLYGFSDTSDSAKRYRMFRELLARYRGDREGARRALVPSFGKSYFFYYVFNESGAVE